MLLMADKKQAGKLGWMLDKRIGHSPTTGVRISHDEARAIRDVLLEVADTDPVAMINEGPIQLTSEGFKPL
jgi:hypothetical protein